MGIYSGVLAYPKEGFWFVAIIGAIVALLPYVINLIIDYNRNPYGKDRSDLTKDQYPTNKRFAVASGIFTVLASFLLLHLFGDKRVLSWAYEIPDRSNPASGWDVMIVPFGPVFFLLVVFELVVAFVAVRNKFGGWGLLSVFMTLFLLQAVTGVPIFPWIFANKVLSLVFIGLYILIGVVWSFFYKWDNLVATHKENYDEIRANWLKMMGYNENTDFTLEDKVSWETYFNNNKVVEKNIVVEHRPKFSDHKSELLGWASLWPISMFETFLFDWLAEVFARIYARLGVVLEWIMAKRWAGTESHMLTDEERALLEDQKKKK